MTSNNDILSMTRHILSNVDKLDDRIAKLSCKLLDEYDKHILSEIHDFQKNIRDELSILITVQKTFLEFVISDIHAIEHQNIRLKDEINSHRDSVMLIHGIRYDS